MILRIKKQREVHNLPSDDINNVLAAKSNIGYNKIAFKKGVFGKKDDRICIHCKSTGHTKDTCFKVHGYPKWFMKLKNKKKGKAIAATVSQTHDTTLEPTKAKESDWNEGLFNMLQL